MKHDHFPTKENPTRGHLAHNINMRSESRLHQILGKERAIVNSMHHQAVKRLADNLIASATAPDGIIEGVEGANGQYIIGVQWHPEELVETDPLMQRLFHSFVEATVSKA
jgi:putative glutamine amidotransferase